jgi:hypothetical protein
LQALSLLDSLRGIQFQEKDGGPRFGSARRYHCSIEHEMLLPIVTARIEETDDGACYWIAGNKIGSFVLVAEQA